MTKRLVPILALAAGLALAGCMHGDGGGDGDGALVQMVGAGTDGFDPKEITVDVGTEVVWRNADTQAHNVYANGTWGMESMFEGGDLLGPGETFRHTFTEAGTYHYRCEPHSSEDWTGMTGVVHVVEAM